MPSFPTILDIAKINGTDMEVGLVDETTRAVPELSGKVTYLGKEISVPNVGAARTIKGQQYKTLIRVSLPIVNFRNANEPGAPVKSVYENRLVETFYLNPRWECDKMVADVCEDGPEYMLALEADGIVKAAMQRLGQQFYYGRAQAAGSDAKGHPGLVDFVDAGFVVDATGTTANGATSVWAVIFGPKNIQWVYGANGDLEVTQPRVESIDPAGGGTRFTAYVQELMAYPGLQCLNKFSAGRIKNLTAQAGKTLTDALMGKLLSSFPVGFTPDAFFASRQSIEQLRGSRTATNETGKEAPWPNDFQGIPIIPTDSLLNTEAIA